MTQPLNDFNDLAQKHGLEAVRETISAAQKVYYVPFGYKVDNSGVYRINDEETLPVCDPLYVIALARDENGNNWGRLLSWQDQDGNAHNWPMPNDMLAGDGADYRRILLSKGLGIRAGKKAQNALHDYILSAAPKDRVLSVSMPGWHNGQYVTVNNTIYGQGEGRVLLQSSGALPRFEKKGTLESWQDQVAKYAVGNSRLVLSISAAFAGTLLFPANEGSGGFHFSGESSGGKTTALRVSASVWGNPFGSSRFADKDKLDEKIIDRAGFKSKTYNDEYEYLVFPEVFRSEILGGTKNERSIIKAAIQLGLIEPDSNGKSTKPRDLPGFGKKRVICITPFKLKEV